MSEIKTSFEYTLSSPIKYSDDGEFVESDLLVLYAPSMKEMRFAAKLKRHFYAALESNEETNKRQTEQDSSKPESEEINAEMLMFLLERGGKDLEAIYSCFSLLLCTKVCKIDDKIDMKKSILEGLPFVEVEEILGRYLDSFLLQSFKNQIDAHTSKT